MSLYITWYADRVDELYSEQPDRHSEWMGGLCCIPSILPGIVSELVRRGYDVTIQQPVFPPGRSLSIKVRQNPNKYTPSGVDTAQSGV